MADATFSWTKSPSSNVEQYQANIGYNGAAQPPVLVIANSAQDASGYSLDLATAVPSITLQPNDNLTFNVVAVDTVDNLESTPDVATPVTVPPGPTAPLPPENATITLV